MAQPHSGSKLPRDCISVIEESKDKNAYRNYLLQIVSELTVFFCQKPAALCLCTVHCAVNI
jgi:hypothetical protein